ncbi:MAG: aminotransferase class V-fold PLP-dependent enzyme [candidate division KSB1 bacterium]|nr:aminotransferase class V-fold PLP-dependent enzyme [candidate division KSB1 bacterium]
MKPTEPHPSMLTDRDVVRYRREFAIVPEYAYLNHASNAPESRRVKEKILEHLRDCEYGDLREEQWHAFAEQTRKLLADLIQAEPEEITFVQSVTAAAALVAQALRLQPGDNIVTPVNQFPANIHPWLNLQNIGVETRLVKMPRDGSIETLADAIDKRTRLLSLCFVEYDDGWRHDLAAVGELCRRRNVLFFVDGTQGVGALRMNVRAVAADFVAVNGVKWLMGPWGQGMLYIRKELLPSLFTPTLGWLSVENPTAFSDLRQPYKQSVHRFEGGCQNLLGIAGLGASVSMLAEVGVPQIEERVLWLTERAASLVQEKGYELVTRMTDGHRSGILSFRHRRVPARMVYEQLLEKKVVTSERNGLIRISPHFYNNAEDIDRLVEALP